MMEMFLKILTAKVTPWSVTAACVFGAWQIAENSGSIEVALGMVVVVGIAFIGHYWGRDAAARYVAPGSAAGKRIRIAVMPLAPDPETASYRFITPRDASLVDMVIDAGNAAAHRSYSPSEDDLRTCIEVVKHMMHGVYVLKPKVERVMKNTPARPRKP